MNIPNQPMAAHHQIHTYTELRQKIHDDLRIQHPEWVQPNGESPMCDSYEARLMELLDAFARKGSNESVAGVATGPGHVCSKIGKDVNAETFAKSDKEFEAR